MHRHRWRVTAALAIASLLFATLRATRAFASDVPPDLVRTKDGGMLRGTIVEVVPGKTVTIVDIAGQTRTIPMDTVTYAGPAAVGAAPTPPAPPSPPAGPPVLTPAPPALAPSPGLRLLADEPNWTYYVQGGTSEGVGMVYNGVSHAVTPVGVSVPQNTRLCTAPCTTALAPGSYDFGIERPDQGIIYAPAISLRGDETLKASLVSRSGARWGTFLAGVAVFVVGLLVASSGKRQDCMDIITGADAAGNVTTTPSCTDVYPNEVLGGVLAGVGASAAIFGPFIGDGMRVAPVAP